MAAPSFDLTAPAAANAWDDDLDQIRDNVAWLMTAAASNNFMLPGWTTTASGADLSEPDYIKMESGSLEMRWTFTWSSGSVTQVVWAYDDGTGLTTLTGGTVSISYDGSGNFSGATTA